METKQTSRVTADVALTVTIADEQGKPAYAFKVAGGIVQIEQKQIGWSVPKVAVDDLREALNAVYAMTD